MIGEAQPASGPIENANTAAVQPIVASSAPAASSLSRSRLVSRSVVRARWIITRPIGTLMRKAQRHDTSVSAPPTISPITEPTPVIAAKIAVAALRAGPFGKVVAISASAVGEAIAAPTPCNSRAVTRVASFQANPHRIDAMVNRATPTTNVRLRPITSPRRPPSSIRPPKVST